MKPSISLHLLLLFLTLFLQSKNLSSQDLPSLQTNIIDNISLSTAFLSGEITNHGSSEITTTGFVWSTNELPSIETNIGLINTSMINDSISTYIYGLSSGTFYYVRSFATNSYGTSYGQEQTFTTLTPTNCGIVTDVRDDNTYNTVLIGSQCWMTENLKFLPQVTGPNNLWNSTDERYAVQNYTNNNNSVLEAVALSNYQNYGVLYNWTAAITACPDGWHLPNLNEWNILIDYLETEFNAPNENIVFSAGNIIKSCSQVNSPIGQTCSTQTHPRWNSDLLNFGFNGIGFSALPGGFRSSTGIFGPIGNLGTLWASSEVDETSSKSLEISYASGKINSFTTYKSSGLSVRCLKNADITATPPIIETGTITNLHQIWADIDCTISSDGGSIITSKGFVISHTANPSIEDNCINIQCGYGNENFSTHIEGLIADTTYYIRAYAVNNVGISYGDELILNTPDYPNCGTLIDSRDGKEYKTVLINSQCWMAENLKYLPVVNTDHPQWAATEPMYAVNGYSNPAGIVSEAMETDNYKNYGVLYSWASAISACPDGWRLPETNDFNLLLEYLYVSYGIKNENTQNGAAISLTSCRNVNSPYICDCNTNESPYWVWSGNSYGKNMFGFSILPGGSKSTTNFQPPGYEANFWHIGFNYNNDAIPYRMTISFLGLIEFSSSSGSNGYSLRCIKEINPTAANPDITTDSVEFLNIDRVNVYGTVISDSDAPILSKGFVYDTLPLPDLERTIGIATMGTSEGQYYLPIGALLENETYYIRAFATNEVGTAYGNQLEITTESFPSCGTITDSRDGETYKTVLIGDQCWMAENLRYLPTVCGPNAQWNVTTPLYGVYGYTDTENSVYAAKGLSTFNNYGVIYNWYAATSACPEGWHLPYDEEWLVLLDYMEDEHGIHNSSNPNALYSGEALKSCRQRYSSLGCGCTTEIEPYWDYTNSSYTKGTNVFGFNGLPGGYRYYSSNYSNIYSSAYFWTASEATTTYADYRYLSYSMVTLYSDNSNKKNGMSIRCIKNYESLTVLPEFDNFIVTDVNPGTANVSVDLEYQSDAIILNKGFVYSLTPNPTIETNTGIIELGYGSSDFSATIYGLNQNTTYYVRAFATNELGAAYTDELSFTTTEFSNCGTLIDTRDNKSYETVIIGEICWMAENLKYLPSINGSNSQWTSSVNGYSVYNYTSSTSSVSTAMATEDYSNYGVLYNWNAAQSACPEGWVLPDSITWIAMLEYLQTSFGITNNLTDGNASNVLKSCRQNNSPLACECETNTQPYWSWNPLNFGTNTFGFSALPGGYRDNLGTFSNRSKYVKFWTSNENSATNSTEASMINTNGQVLLQSTLKSFGYSVRCIKLPENIVVAPTVITYPASEIAKTSVMTGAEIIDNGGDFIQTFGLVIGTESMPTIESNIARVSFYSTATDTVYNLKNLTGGTTYFLRAYASNSADTSYGNEITFTTEEFANCGILTDNRDGSTYRTISIGSQCWMAENLRYLPEVTGLFSSANINNPIYSVYNYSNSANSTSDAQETNNYRTYGVLYNYHALTPGDIFSDSIPSNVQGLCPSGWHLPSEDEWKELEIAIGMNESTVNMSGFRGTNEGCLLSANSDLWTDGVLDSDVSLGLSGFDAFPGGYRNGSGTFSGINSSGYWFSCTKSSPTEIYIRTINATSKQISRATSGSINDSYSIRCVKNNSIIINLPQVSTKPVSISGYSSMASGGTVISDGGSEILARGIVWNLNPNPDLDNNNGYTVIEGQTGFFNSEMPGLIQAKTYYVRAYATNSLGTAYGNEIEFYTDICTPMYANILITQPPADSEGFINICTNTELNMTDPVLFIAAGSYPESGYPLSDETVLFKWKIDNNFVAEGYGMTTFETTFTAGQGHVISLVIEDTAGCRSINDNTVKIRASLFGGFISDGCYANPTTIEQGQPVEICANHNIIDEWHSPVLPTLQDVADTIHIDNVTLTCYTSDLFIDEYSAAATIENSGQLKSIGLNLVHSYLGDLTMFVQCPNGQEVQIGNQGGGGCNLGVPPMEAYWYEITNNASQTMQQAATSLTTLPAGQYLPFQSLDGLIGCPINGTWKLRICDNWAADEGYICGWYLDFDTLNTNPWQYEIAYNAEWSGNYGALINYPDSICTIATYNTTETPFENSIQPFTFTISDNLGCSYDTTLFVTVLSNNPADLPIVETSGVSDIYSTKALCSGEVISEGNSPVSAKGIVFGTSENPTIYSCSGFSTESGGIGTFSSMINNLLPETEYYIRAYATNEFGTAYGDILAITTNAIPEILCPTDKYFCIEQDTVLILNESSPVGGQYYFDGIEQTEINIQNLSTGIYTVTYLFEYEPDATISCNFDISVSQYPLPVSVESSPTSGVISLTSLAYVYFEDTNIGDNYWVTFNDTIIGDTIYGNGYNQFSAPIHYEGCYSVYSSSIGGCVLFQDVICFAINSGNKICVNTSLPNNEQFENNGDVKVKLFKEEIDNNQNTVIIQTAETYPESNHLAVFEDLESGDYYVESIIQNQSEYSEFQQVVFYKTATLSENALDVTLFGNTTKLLYIVHNPNQIQYGNNTANGSVGILIENNYTGIADKVVVLKNTSTDEILKITVTNQTGNYAFDTVPSDTEIEIFVSDFEYPNWTAYNVLTENNEDYVANFIMISDSVHPYNPVSNLTSGKNLNNFDIIPNPAKDQIKILTDAEVTDIYIFDNNGKLIKRITENTNSEIEVNFLSPAVYYLTIVDKKGNIGVKKFVKQ